MKKVLALLNARMKQHKTLISNFSYLSLLQVFNMILPLITYPYLIRVLGTEMYGLIVFAQAIIGYLVIIVGFGFNISATKEISINRNSIDKISEIVSSVLIIKSILFIFTLLLLSVLLFFIPQSKGYQILFYLVMWMCLYDVIFPIWYFQGIEKMNYITWITLLSRLTFLSLIFLIIHSPDDYLFIPLINGIGALLAGFVSLYIIFKKHGVSFILQPYKLLKQYFVASIPIFVSNVSTSLYVSTNKVVVGALLGMEEVAFFDLAEKLTTLIKTPIFIIGQSIFPKISRERNLVFLRKSFSLVFIIGIFVIIIGAVFSKYIIEIIGGLKMTPAVPLFRILLLSLLPISISMFFANLALLAWGFNKEYLVLRVSANLLFLLGLFLIVVFFEVELLYLAWMTVIIEMFVAFFSVAICDRRNLNFLKKLTQ